MAAMLSDDERSTLEAALAFIDSNYDPTDDTDGDSADSGASVAGAERVAVPSSFVDAAKRARNVQAAARSNRKKRAELLLLRESVRQLEATHAALLATRRATTQSAKRPRGSDGSAAAGDAGRRVRAALELATAESLKLSESRARNRRLRAALDQQRDVGAALVQVLKKRLELKCVRDLLNETALNSTAVSVTDGSRRVAAGWSNPRDRQSLYMDLNARLQVFAVEANSVLTAKANEMVLSESRTRAYRHATLGPMVEFTSSTHIPCDIEDAWRHMMSTMCTGRAKAGQDNYGYRATIRPNPELGVSEKEYSMEIPDAAHAGFNSLSVEGFVLFDMFESTDWKLFIWAAVVSIRGDGTQVRERGWTAMTRTPTGGCALHRQYDFYTASSSAQHEPPCAKTKFLAEKLLQKARQDCTRVENVMAARFGSDASNVAALFGGSL